MKTKLIRIIFSAILMIAGSVVGLIYLPVSMELSGTNTPQKVENIQELAKTVLPVSTEMYLNGEVADDFVPYTLQEVASLSSTATSVLKSIYTKIDRQLEVKFEKEVALYHSIGTLRSDTITLIGYKKILTETTWTFDFEIYISKDKLLIKYNQWEFKSLVHNQDREETEEDVLRSKILTSLQKNYGKWLEIPSLKNISEDTLKAQAALAKNPEKELYILMYSYAIANEYTDMLYQVNNLNYDLMSSFFDCLISNFNEFNESGSFYIQFPSDSNSIFAQFKEDQSFLGEKCYSLPYYKNNVEYITDENGNKVPNDICEIWKRIFATSGNMMVHFDKEETIIYEQYHTNINDTDVTCLAKIKDIGSTKINPPKEDKSLLNVFYNPLSYAYELDEKE